VKILVTGVRDLSDPLWCAKLLALAGDVVIWTR
jgi:hypothetical protein